jgi:DNA invertase Pin-like site-specific DNA recombinase
MTIRSGYAQRVLGGIRQSKTKDNAVSPEAQRNKIQDWSDANGYTVVKFTLDLSKSGKVSCFSAGARRIT